MKYYKKIILISSLFLILSINIYGNSFNNSINSIQKFTKKYLNELNYFSRHKPVIDKNLLFASSQLEKTLQKERENAYNFILTSNNDYIINLIKVEYDFKLNDLYSTKQYKYAYLLRGDKLFIHIILNDSNYLFKVKDILFRNYLKYFTFYKNIENSKTTFFNNFHYTSLKYFDTDVVIGIYNNKFNAFNITILFIVILLFITMLLLKKNNKKTKKVKIIEKKENILDNKNINKEMNYNLKSSLDNIEKKILENK